MFGVLRFVRGVFGLLFGLQILGMLPILSWLQHPESVTGNMAALLLIKVLAALVCGALFFGLRALINRLYLRKHGVAHPTLANKRWAL